MRFPPPSPFVFLEDSLSVEKAKAGLLFENPVKILKCQNLSQVRPTLNLIEKELSKGFYLAGWIAYEAGYAFHPTLKKEKLPLPKEPLIWFGVFKRPRNFTSLALKDFFKSFGRKTVEGGLKNPPKPDLSQKEFQKTFKTISDYILAGDIYQVNYTFQLPLESFGSLAALYSKIRKQQPTPYSGFIDTGSTTILSFSPELFMSKKGGTLIARPMKGTAKPGKNLEETEAIMHSLKSDKKNRAENLMITDLIRNDFSKVCEPKSVWVPQLFQVERFKTVLQMSSEVRGKVKKGLPFSTIIEALFPCGSITGAPKIRAMQVIREIEKKPRGIYTGAIGFLTPGGDFTFNVPIRTGVFEKSGKGTLGVGSGIVFQSNPKEEYKECLLKSNFLKPADQNFSLIETLLWTPKEGFHFLDDHLERLKASSDFFNFEGSLQKIKTDLKNLPQTFDNSAPKKIRLLVNREGKHSVQVLPLAQESKKGLPKIKISRKRVNSNSVWLYHKTTNRSLYDREYKNAKNSGFLDFIFLNEKNEISEGAIHNVFILGIRGQMLTPRVESGLLPGIFRAHLIKTKGFKESSLTCEDLKRARKIWLGNSVSGLIEVVLEGG